MQLRLLDPQRLVNPFSAGVGGWSCKRQIKKQTTKTATSVCCSSGHVDLFASPHMQMESALTFEPGEPNVNCTWREVDEASWLSITVGVEQALEPTRKPH